MNRGQEHMAKQRENVQENKHTQPAPPELAAPNLPQTQTR